jgi:hypothetical protein
MKFRVIRQKTPSGAHSPIQVVEQPTGRGVGWINRFLDREYVRRLADKSLYSYAHSLLHFVRWWESVHHTGDISSADLTASTLLDYVRFQSSRQPPPSADLSYDCLRSTGPDQWAIHVPLGKLKTERMVPVDSFVRELVHRLRFFRSLDPLPVDGRLLAWSGSKVGLLARLREYLHMVCYSVSLPIDIVPHQMRHTYGTEMLRSGMGFATVMKLLGHTDPAMTMRYVDVTLTDLQREFQLARSKPRHLAPQPKTSPTPTRTGIDGLIDSLLATQHVLEMFRRSLLSGTSRATLDRLSNRLTKILTETRKLREL